MKHQTKCCKDAIEQISNHVAQINAVYPKSAKFGPSKEHAKCLELSVGLPCPDSTFKVCPDNDLTALKCLLLHVKYLTPITSLDHVCASKDAHLSAVGGV